MTLQEIAINAVNEIQNHLRVSSLFGVERVKLIDRQNVISDRFRIVWVPSRSRWYAEDQTVTTSNEDVILAEDSVSCEHCDGLEHIHNLSEAYGRRGQLLTICDECHENETWRCDSCEDTYVSSVSSYESCGGETLCSACYSQEEEEEEEQVNPASLPAYHAAHRYSRPMSIPWGSPAYSMEWEIEAEDRAGLLLAIKNSLLPMTSWERDGSLNSDKGFELLIQWSPSLPDLCRRAWEVVDTIKQGRYGVSCWDSGRCGIHINICRNHIHRRSVMRLLYIVLRNKTVIEAIAGRSNTHWAMFPERRSSLLKAWANGMLGKYTAIRCGDDRLEWRVFRGTIRKDRLKLYCDTVDLCHRLAQGRIPAVQLAEAANRELLVLWDAFLAGRKGGK